MEEQEQSRRPSSTPSRSSLMKKSFRYRPNRWDFNIHIEETFAENFHNFHLTCYRRSTVIHFKQKFRSFKGMCYSF